MIYTNEELDLLEAIETKPMQKVPFNNDQIKSMAKETILYNNEKKQISINIKKSDLDYVKQKASDIGISYQNIIQALIHNYTTQKIQVQL